MYRCDVCKTVVPPGTKLGRIPEEIREKTYPPRSDATPYRRPGKKKLRWKDDPGGTGYELVSELKACPRCYAEWEKELHAEESLREQLDDDQIRTEDEEDRAAA